MKKSDIKVPGAPNHIERRDFLNGAAMVAGSLLLPKFALAQDHGADASAREYFLERGIDQQDPRYYPPALTGMRGNHPGSFEPAHKMRDEHGYHAVTPVLDTKEEYDLVVVGGGISGLSAAWFHRAQQPNARILILENHDDFGGHAKRNEFHPNGQLLIGYGGTQAIEVTDSYSPQASGLLKSLGIELARFEKYYDSDFRHRNNLTHCVFFDKETFGQDRLLNEGKPDWPTFIAKMPLSPRARADLQRIQLQKIDYLPDMKLEEKKRLLARISFRDFLLKYAKVDPQVVTFFQRTTHGGYASGIDAVSALNVIAMGNKLQDQEFLGGPSAALAEGLGLSDVEFYNERYIYHFPDGNASIARLLVRSLIPGAAPGSTMEDIVTARFNYARLDDPGSPVRIRLNSTAVQATNLGAPAASKGVEVTYVRDGKTYRVKGKRCVLACWNAIIPYLCPEMPETQKAALHRAVKAPLVYTNVQIRNWQAIRAAGLVTSYCPGAYFSEVYLDWPVSIGDYTYTKSPDQPAVLHLVRVPTSPGLPIRDQFRAGRAELYTTSFEVFEKNIHDQLGRMFGPFGFDSQRDIQAITVNRWAHGYAYGDTELWDAPVPDDQRPNVIGRKRFGRIAIANSDAQAAPETQAAIDQAYRAVQELLALG